jgi:hypothetical protein
MKSETFQRVLRAASALNPYGKKLTDDDLLISWMTLSPRVQQEVTDQMWLYALQQHRMDPSPDKELPLDMQLLKHLWKCENGAPCLRWGPKEDLPQRMASAGQFHGQPKSPYELGEDLGHAEPRLAPQGALKVFEEAA